MVVTAFLLGFFGSAGHCLGMCSGISLLLARNGVAAGWRLLLAHIGRVTTYAVLGALAGGAGLALASMGGSGMTGDHAHSFAAGPYPLVQGVLAILAAALAGYMALALVGRAPSPEIYLQRLSRHWRQALQRAGRQPQGLLTPLLVGLVWGLLPCGLVLAALLTAAVSATPWQGALSMMAFGAGTWPLLLGLSLLARKRPVSASPWLRSAAAAVVAIFGMQLLLRGLAAWSWIGHFHLGGVTFW